jgi:DNA-binding NarL/FixJ family response regulator
MDVARHLIEGLGIIEVSNRLNLSSSTVSTYKSRIFEKLGVHNIPDLISLFKMNADKE